MNELFSKFGFSPAINIVGLLIQPPNVIVDDGYDFILIGDDGFNYHLLKNRKTHHMHHLVDSKIEIKCHIEEDNDICPSASVIKYSQINPIEPDHVYVNDVDIRDFQPYHFDYAFRRKEPYLSIIAPILKYFLQATDSSLNSKPKHAALRWNTYQKMDFLSRNSASKRTYSHGPLWL